jgi:FkbM family methyltransferase
MTVTGERFYAQYDEDRVLAHMFARTEKGTCLEVGANDGISLSNTYYFEQRGWRCILIEPNRDCCDKIRSSRRATVFECAASGKEGSAILHVGSGGDDLYSSLDIEQLTANQDRYKPIVVPTRTIDSMLEEAGVASLDFATIDVEGHENQALQGFSLDRWKPHLVLIEDNSDMADSEVEQHMRQAGYFRFWRSGGNDWYSQRANGRASLLIQILRSRCFSWKGFLKGNAPKKLTRIVVITKRALLRRLRPVSVGPRAV